MAWILDRQYVDGLNKYCERNIEGKADRNARELRFISEPVGRLGVAFAGFQIAMHP